MHVSRILTLCLVVFALSQVGFSQEGGQRQSVINIKVEKSIKSISYRASGSTEVGFQGTALAPRVEGKAKVENKQGSLKIEAELSKLEPATRFGTPYLTYVLWAISPEGRPSNLGELMIKGDKGKVLATTRLQSFGMIVTAEPYFAVTIPSEQVVAENIVRSGTMGKIESIDAKFELLQRGVYDPAKLEGYRLDGKTPLELYQARNAIQIARLQQADKYAADSWTKAERALKNAEDYYKRKQKKPTIMASRETVQAAEDARVIAMKRMEEEQLAMQRQEAARREAQAKAEAEAQARRRAEEEAARHRADADRLAAEKRAMEEEAARQRADAERMAAEKRKMEAEMAAARAAQERAKAEAQERRAKEEAERARAAAEKSERERQELRQRLLDQFNRILPTEDTPRGLRVTLGDILFDTGKYNLRSTARESLAKLTGIVLGHPGLNLEVAGHTDSTGSDQLNQRLSEQRAGAVRDYLAEQGLDPNTINAVGYGKTMPIADNNTAAGRQKNRRVEIIIFGEVIGTKVGD